MTFKTEDLAKMLEILKDSKSIDVALDKMNLITFTAYIGDTEVEVTIFEKTGKNPLIVRTSNFVEVWGQKS